MMMGKIDMKRFIQSKLTAWPKASKNWPPVIWGTSWTTTTTLLNQIIFFACSQNAEKARCKQTLAKQASLEQVTFHPNLPLGEGLGKSFTNWVTKSKSRQVKFESCLSESKLEFKFLGRPGLSIELFI